MCSGLVTHSQKTSITRKPQELNPVDLTLTNIAKNKRLGIKDTLKIGTWNVRSLMNKEEELVQELKKKNINLAIITETKKKLQGTKEVGEYIMI